MLLWPELKSLNRIVYLSSKFGEEQNLVLDTCVSTFATTKARLQLFEDYRFVACEMDYASLPDALSSLMEVYAKQNLSSESDITNSYGRFEASNVFVEKIVALVSTSTIAC